MATRVSPCTITDLLQAPLPGVNLNDNVIVGNHFSGNGADSGDAATPGPVGINIFSVAPITGTVVSQNTFDNEAIDVAFKASAGELSVHLNNFKRGAIGVDNLGTAPIDATEDWWGSSPGPGSPRMRNCVWIVGLDNPMAGLAVSSLIPINSRKADTNSAAGSHTDPAVIFAIRR